MAKTNQTFAKFVIHAFATKNSDAIRKMAGVTGYPHTRYDRARSGRFRRNTFGNVGGNEWGSRHLGNSDDVKICEIRGQINSNHGQRAGDQCDRQVSLRIVVPTSTAIALESPSLRGSSAI